MLIPVVRWVLQQHLPADVPINSQFADWFDYRPGRPKGLAESIRASLDLAPCDLLVVHRDAENDTREKRINEITAGMTERESEVDSLPPHVCLVPVRMSEAWLLFDEQAIRSAAGNPNGKVKLPLPNPRAIEGLPDPKEVLRSLFRTASELTGRRLKKLDTSGIPRVVAEYIDDFTPLRRLAAFQAFEDEIRLFAESWSPEE